MTIEVTAKKVDDAINQGLAQLGVTLDRVTVEVVEQGGLFRKAKVRLTLDVEETTDEAKKTAKAETEQKPDKPAKSDKSDRAEKPENAEKPDCAAKQKSDAPAKQSAKAPAQKPDGVKPAGKKQAAKPAAERATDAQEKPAAERATDAQEKPVSKPRALRDEDKAAAAKALEFVKGIVVKMGFDDATVEVGDNPEKINIIAPQGDDSLIIGRHGETLSALAYLAETGARAEKCHINVTVDCNGYRDRRAASLTAMARRRADECATKRRRIKLEPMERADRRTIHNALTDDDRITTASEGKEPHRYIVIYPKNNRD